MREPYSGRALAELAELLEASGWKIEGGEVRRPAWHAQAACRGAGPEAFFVEDKGPGARRGRVRRGAQHEPAGLWGGLSPRRRQRRRVAA